MRMSGCPCLTRRQFRRDPTDALFADQSQSILDNLVAVEAQPSMELLGWNSGISSTPGRSVVARYEAVPSTTRFRSAGANCHNLRTRVHPGTQPGVRREVGG